MKLKAKWMGFVLAGAGLSGCGALLGLDEFTEGTGGSGTSTGTIWSKQFGEAATAEDLAVAPDGSILVSGVFATSINFGPTPTTMLTLAINNVAFFLAKLAPDGSHLWSKALIQKGDSNVFSRVAVASDGQIFLSGIYEDAIDIDGQMLSASAGNQLSFFVASFDKDGKRLWAKSFGFSSKAVMSDLAVDPDGDPVIVGEYANGAIVFDGATYSSPVGKNAFVAKLAHSDGSVAWSNSYGADMSDQSAMAVAVDSAGNIVVAGTTNAFIDFGSVPSNFPSGGGLDVFVVQLGSNGTPVWHTSFHGPNDEMVSSVAVDSLGDVYVAGAFSGVTQFEAQDIPTSKSTTGATDTDFFLVKMNAKGAHAWIKQLGDSKPQIPQSPFFALPALPRVSLDSKGDVLFAGGFLGSLQLGTTPLTSLGDSDWFIGKLTSSGDHLWSKSFGDSAPAQFVTSISSDPKTDAVVLGGVNDGSLAIGPGAPLKAKGTLSVVVAKLNP